MSGMTIKQLKERWAGDWQGRWEQLTSLLKSGRAPASNWPLTPEGKLDLRGYTVPQQKTEKIPPHRKNPIVLEGPLLKNLRLANADLSHGDWESTQYRECHFENCVFDATRLRDGRFHGCTFTNITFHKADIGGVTFSTSLNFFSRRKTNFLNVVFEKSNLSCSYILGQGLEHCAFHDCKLGELMISGCHLDDVKFTGMAQTFIFTDNKVRQVDFRESYLRNVRIYKQPLENILFPDGDGYYIFKDKAKEIAWLQSQPMDETEKKMLDLLVYLWRDERTGKDDSFVEVHFLEPDEQEIAKRILEKLKNRS